MKFIAVLMLILSCFIPLIPEEYEVKSQTLEPYTVTETIRVPYRAAAETVRWQESEAYQQWKHNFKTSIEDSVPAYYGVGKIPSGQWISEYIYVTKYREEETIRTEYRVIEETTTIKCKVSVVEWLDSRW